jgi:hypothetical protein
VAVLSLPVVLLMRVLAPVVSVGPNKKVLGQDTVSVKPGGSFRAGPFTNDGKPCRAGAYPVEVLAYFTRAWQPCEVVHQVGVETDAECRTAFSVNPTMLPLASDLVPGDPEFPQAGRHLLKVRRQVIFPGESPDLIAIEAVKNARLNVIGRGLSADPIGQVVALLCQQGCTTTGWSAKRSELGSWIVTLDFVDEGAAMVKNQAQWDYNAKTNRTPAQNC